MVCIDVDLGSSVLPYMDTTEGLDDSFIPSCTPGSGAADAGHLFAAPADGFFAFETAGSAFDTVLTVLDGNDCPAPEIGCDDDVSLSDSTSRVATYLTSGQEVIVVVDGYAATEEGDYTLSVVEELGPCGTVLSGPLPLTTSGTTAGESDKLSPSCIASPGADVILTWQAPAEGTYVIDLAGSSFDTVLHVRDGECTPVELACNDDSGGTPQSSVDLDLLADQVITIVIDGYGPTESGPYQLTITSV